MDREDDSNTGKDSFKEEVLATKLGGETTLLTTTQEAMDTKKQPNEMRAVFNQNIEETTGKIELTTERLEEAEQCIGDMESWGMDAKGAMSSLLKT